MSKPDNAASAKRKTGRWRHWRKVLYALLAISLFQYVNDGEITWPSTVASKIGGTLQEYANRPGASWREAAEQLEEIGAAREGQPVPEFGLAGRVVRVADGDTISVLDRSNTQHKIRLHGIDTPERDQPYGKKAWDALSSKVAGKTVGVVVLGKDRYGRTDGTVYLDDININLAMVTDGHAWWYRYHAPDEHLLEAAEASARARNLGLWSDKNPVPPWDWRRQQKYHRP